MNIMKHIRGYRTFKRDKRETKVYQLTTMKYIESKNFENVYTTQDKNIFRRRSMYGKTQFLNIRINLMILL